MTNDRPVLIVDDNREIVFGTSLRLQAAGYETLAAYDGAEGLMMATENQPAAVVLDVEMPQMNGLEAVGELKRCEQTKQIPVVMLSASLRDKQQALESGARFFLTKPCRNEDLLAALHSAIDEATAVQVPGVPKAPSSNSRRRNTATTPR